MSLQPQLAYVIPDETRRIAHAAFPKGTLCLRLVEALGQLYLDEQFAERGNPLRRAGAFLRHDALHNFISFEVLGDEDQVMAGAGSMVILKAKRQDKFSTSML